MNFTGGLTSKNPFVRKATAAALLVPRACAKASGNSPEYERRCPVLANSFPKSGTHLLQQIVRGISGLRDYGVLLSSMTSSFQFCERTPGNMVQCLRRIVPGEMLRGHVQYHESYASVLRERRVVHYFIYRDPRDVVLSEARYLAKMNRWHRLHSYFRNLSDEEAILLSINGIKDTIALRYPDVAERFAKFHGWLHCPDTLAIKFEDLRGDKRDWAICEISQFYVDRAAIVLSTEKLAAQMANSIDPTKSHTMRVGRSGGWRDEFSVRCKDRFKKVTGDLLIELGYETNNDW